MDSIPAASIVINAIAVPLCIVAWLQLMLGNHKDPKMLAANGKESLKYFTVLSNLLSALVSLAYLVAVLCLGAYVPTWLLVLKLVGTTAVMLTFLTVVVLLGPALGWKRMYASGNLWLHLVLPLLAAVDCCLFVRMAAVPWQCTLWGMLPTMLYGIVYLYNVQVHGVEENGKVYDFYGFTRWGNNKIPLVCVGMLLASWLIALLLYWGSTFLCIW